MKNWPKKIVFNIYLHNILIKDYSTTLNIYFGSDLNVSPFVLMHKLHRQSPAGASVSGGFKQYMWYPRSQSSQKRSLSSFSELPHIVQRLHSMQSHLYCLTDSIIVGLKPRHDVWWKYLLHSEHVMNLSLRFVWPRGSVSIPKQTPHLIGP